MEDGEKEESGGHVAVEGSLFLLLFVSSFLLLSFSFSYLELPSKNKKKKVRGACTRVEERVCVCVLTQTNKRVFFFLLLSSFPLKPMTHHANLCGVGVSLSQCAESPPLTCPFSS